MTDIIASGVQCLRDEATAILDMVPRINDDFERAVKLICDCRGKVIVTGVGKSGHCGSKIAATLASTGTPSFFLNPLDAYHGDLGMIARGDVVMAISYSGGTDELLRFIPLVMERDIPIIGMSGNPDSLLARYSTCHLNIAVSKEADPLNLAPTSSTTVTLAMGDALACALVNLRRFKPEDFARFHPGGSLGKRLLSRVRDFMMSDELPVVHPDQLLSDAIITMTHGKKGQVVALDDERRVVGIITDGDLRRTIQRYGKEMFMLTVGDVMTSSPKTIKQSERLSVAADMMLANSIHSLVVLDDNDNFVGIIDYFSCL